MSLKKEWEQLYLSLPKKKRDEYYSYLEFLANYLLENPHLETVSSKEIEIASEGVISAQKFGSVLSRLGTLTQVPEYPNRKRVMKWQVAQLKDVVCVGGLQAKNLKQLRESKTEIKHQKYAVNPLNAQYIVENFKQIVMPSYSDPMLAKIDSYFSSTYSGSNFILMYHIARRCIQMSVPRILPPSKRWYDLKDPHQYCLEFPEVENSYPVLTKKLLRVLYPELDDMGQLVETLHSNRPHRLNCIVMNPYKDWSKKRKGVEYTKQQEESFLHAHHTCFNPRCINPLHISPLTVGEHRLCHSDLDPNHHIMNEHNDELDTWSNNHIPIDDKGFIFPVDNNTPRIINATTSIH